MGFRAQGLGLRPGLLGLDLLWSFCFPAWRTKRTPSGKDDSQGLKLRSRVRLKDSHKGSRKEPIREDTVGDQNYERLDFTIRISLGRKQHTGTSRSCYACKKGCDTESSDRRNAGSSSCRHHKCRSSSSSSVGGGSSSGRVSPSPGSPSSRTGTGAVLPATTTTSSSSTPTMTSTSTTRLRVEIFALAYANTHKNMIKNTSDCSYPLALIAHSHQVYIQSSTYPRPSLFPRLLLLLRHLLLRAL